MRWSSSDACVGPAGTLVQQAVVASVAWMRWLARVRLARAREWAGASDLGASDPSAFDISASWPAVSSRRSLS